MGQYKFLKYPTIIGKAIIKGKMLNRDAGYDLEIPCLRILKILLFQQLDKNFDVGLPIKNSINSKQM